MEILLYVLGAVALLVGLAGVVLPAVPGSALLAIGAALVAWAEDFRRVSGWTVAACAALAVAIWVTDLLAAALGAKAFGASRWAVIGASLGLVVGMFLGLPGIVLGPAVGAIVLEYARDPSFARAMKAGAGAFLGFVLGTAVKVSLAFAIVGLVALALVA
ncbi:MAG TPA: DUF456 domain-containing protein [Anaeromyxobacter sp.]|nr:DUF456 domain-containing protein [Anaeromyxobacter sp.]